MDQDLPYTYADNLALNLRSLSPYSKYIQRTRNELQQSYKGLPLKLFVQFPCSNILIKAIPLDIIIWRMWVNILLNTHLKGFRPSIKTPVDHGAVLLEKIYMFYRIEYWKLNLKFMSNVLSRGFKGVSAPWGGGSVPDCIWREDICPREAFYCCLPSQNAYTRLDFWCPVIQTPWPSTRPINYAEL